MIPRISERWRLVTDSKSIGGINAMIFCFENPREFVRNGEPVGDLIDFWAFLTRAYPQRAGLYMGINPFDKTSANSCSAGGRSVQPGHDFPAFR